MFCRYKENKPGHLNLIIIACMYINTCVYSLFRFDKFINEEIIFYRFSVITEPVPSGAELDQMCNRSLGGIIQIKCRGDKREPIRMRQDSFLSGDKGLNLSCSDNGATCQILRVNSTCYEFEIWIDCFCPPEPTGR